jgi:hypothetical protein
MAAVFLKGLPMVQTMMTSRVGERKREDKGDAPQPGTSGFDIWTVDGQRL